MSTPDREALDRAVIDAAEALQADWDEFVRGHESRLGRWTRRLTRKGRR